MKSEKKKRQRRRKRLENFKKTSKLPSSFLEWIEGLPTEDQVREMEVARENLSKILMKCPGRQPLELL